MSAGSGFDKIHAVVVTLPSLMSRAATDAVELLEEVVEHQFASGTDPYGETWAPSKVDGRAIFLVGETEALSAPRVEALSGAGITVAFDESYAQYHQSGTSKMPRRRIVPDEGDFNRSLWYAAIVEAYSNALLGNGGWRAAGADSVSEG